MTRRKNGPLRLYKSYVFKNKDPIIDLTRTIVQDSGYSYSAVSALSGVSATTLYNWFNGDTRRPQFASINAVGRACGKTLVWVDLKR